MPSCLPQRFEIFLMGLRAPQLRELNLNLNRNQSESFFLQTFRKILRNSSENVLLNVPAGKLARWAILWFYWRNIIVEIATSSLAEGVEVHCANLNHFKERSERKYLLLSLIKFARPEFRSNAWALGAISQILCAQLISTSFSPVRRYEVSMFLRRAIQPVGILRSAFKQSEKSIFTQCFN